MSIRITQTLEVLKDVWSQRPALAMFRVRAVKAVAARRDVKVPTVQDKLVRQSPTIATAHDFDRLVARWLGGEAAPMRGALLTGRIGRADAYLVRAFFVEHC